jgi:hypothetical protein
MSRRQSFEESHEHIHRMVLYRNGDQHLLQPDLHQGTQVPDKGQAMKERLRKDWEEACDYYKRHPFRFVLVFMLTLLVSDCFSSILHAWHQGP